MVEATAYGLTDLQSSTKVAVKMLKCKPYNLKNKAESHVRNLCEQYMDPRLAVRCCDTSAIFLWAQREQQPAEL